MRGGMLYLIRVDFGGVIFPWFLVKKRNFVVDHGTIAHTKTVVFFEKPLQITSIIETDLVCNFCDSIVAGLHKSSCLLNA